MSTASSHFMFMIFHDAHFYKLTSTRELQNIHMHMILGHMWTLLNHHVHQTYPVHALDKND